MREKGRSNYFWRLVFILGVLLLGNTLASAQFTVYGIVKNNKTLMHGKVITYDPMNTVVMDYRGDTLTFDLNKYDFKFTTRKPPKPYLFPDGVRYHRISMGILAGQPGDGGYINYSYHHQGTRLVGYGGGLAFENYGNKEGYDFLVPSGVFYSYFTATNSSPFLRFTAGYGLALKNPSKNQVKARGGINVGAALGLRLSTNKIMIDFAIGARYQKAYYEFNTNEVFKTENTQFRRLDISVGFMW